MNMKNRYGAAETIARKKETLEIGFRRMALAVIIMSTASMIAMGASWYAWSSKPEPRYFAAREDGAIIPLIPVDRPYLSDGAILNFAVEAITQSLTFDFARYRQDLSQASDFFQRPQGWNNFLTALEESKTLEIVRERRMVSSVVANGAVIINAGVNRSGRYAWVIQVPITITFESANERARENRMAEIEIVRLPTWETSRGVGITRVLIR